MLFNFFQSSNVESKESTTSGGKKLGDKLKQSFSNLFKKKKQPNIQFELNQNLEMLQEDDEDDV